MPETVQETRAEGTPTASCKVSSPNLQYLLDWVGRVCGEAKLVLGDGMLAYEAVDAAHVCLVKGSAPVVEQEGSVEIGVDVDLLRGLLKPVPIASPEPFELTVYQAGETLVLEHDRYEYEMSLLDTSGMTDPKPPELDLPCRWEMSAKDWSNFLRRAAKANDHLRLTGTPDGVVGQAEQDHLTVTHELDVDEHEFDLSGQDEVESIFSMDYLDSFRKSNAFQGTVRFELGDDIPIRWEARPGECVLKGMLAPRIEGA